MKRFAFILALLFTAVALSAAPITLRVDATNVRFERLPRASEHSGRAGTDDALLTRNGFRASMDRPVRSTVSPACASPRMASR